MATDSVQIPGYEILRPLGSGGMSTVYLALQRSLDRKVAIKIMRRSGDSSSNDTRQIERRFLLEGRMMAKLPHRNIVAVYDIVSNDVMSYIAMEFLGGGALTDRMRSGIALADAISVIVQISGALEFAHNHGVVHRDLKPANIMFRDSGTPVLTDFGIARYQDGSATKLTQTGMLVGTPTYMSPEQINGLQVDGRADQYSLGILFYELLTGSPPFRGDTPIAVLMAHLTQEPAPLPQEFRSFQDVFNRVLSKDRDNRYATLKEFSDDLKSRLVHSDTLLMKLQIDPNTSSSEQLRALGFYTSTPSGEGLRESLPGRSVSGQRPAISTPLPKPAPPPAVMKKPAATSGLPRWPLALVAVAILLLIVGAWRVFGHRELSKDESELIALWNARASDLIQANQAVVAAPGSDGSALDFIHKVQQKEPGNDRAQELLDQIGKQFATQSKAALDEKRFDDATQLDAQGLKALPKDETLIGLQSRIAQARVDAQSQASADAQKVAQRQAAREKVEKLLASTAPEDLSAALTELAPLLADDSANKDTLALRTRAIETIGNRLQNADAAASFDATATLLKDHEKDLGGDDAYAALIKKVPALRVKTVAADDAKAAALRGDLVLNATPWGKVESIVDADQHPVALPTDTNTPFVLSVPAGNYQITFKQPLSGKTAAISSKVEAKKRTFASTAFGTITAQEYFSRAGW
jgi:serine/threonine-protein kinase PpkA